MKFDVATFGSAFVDVFLESSEFQVVKTDKVKGGVALCQVYGGKVAVRDLTITTGGGATNNAVGFERLGLQTAAVCCVGDDDWGLFIRKKLQSEGVSPLYVQIEEKTQTSYATALVTDDGSRTILAYRGASNRLSWAKVAWDKLAARWFHVSSLGGDFALLTKIIRTAQAKKIEVSLNPGNGELQSGEKLRFFLPHVDILLLNQAEAEKLLRVRGESAVEARLRTLGSKVVVVTRGNKGAVVQQKKGSLLRIGVYPVKRREETGAGDAFGTGFVGGLLLGHDTETALKIGTANASSVITQVGAKAGLLFGPEINEWLKKPMKGES